MMLSKSPYSFLVAALIGVLFISATAYGQQTEIKYLSGTGEDDMVDWQFYCTAGANSGKWTTIGVPSCWELQGFGKYNYGFDKDKDRGMEKGIYKYNFSVSAGWKSKQVNIVFEGVMTDADVQINGKLAGKPHQGAYYRFMYDISKLLKYGKSNLLEVTVAKHSANESVNAAERRADFWLFGGIFRPVYLQVVPKQHIARVAVDAGADGSFKADVFVDGNANASTIKTQFLDGKHKPVGSVIEVPVQPGEGIAAIQTKLAGINPWSPETPNLYYAKFSLVSGGKSLHEYEQRFGFRTVEIRKRDGVYVNGVKTKFKGINRHSIWPTSGRTMSYRLSLQDALLIKDMNMNAVRMSHYPGDAHFYDICDSLGLYVLDELAGWHGNYDTVTGSKLVREMVEKNQNHPSIVMWDNGNEGGHNYALDPVFDGYDLQRRHVIHPWEDFDGFDTQHYRQYNYGITGYEHGHSIVMPTEFLHGWYDGGHGAGLDDYWEKMWNNPLSAGGFLWDFADQGIVRKDLNDSIDTDKFRGSDGIVGPYRQKEGSYFTAKEVFCPVHVPRLEITSDFTGDIPVENRYQFTNLSSCGFVWSLKKMDTVHPLVTTANIKSPDIAPGQKGFLHLELPQDWHDYDCLYLVALDKNGRNLFTWSFPITRPVKTVAKMLETAGLAKPTFTDNGEAFTASANNITVSINKANGLLTKVQNNVAEVPLNGGPVLQEAVNNFSEVTAAYDHDTLVISSTFDRKAHYNKLEWKMYPSGMVRLQVNYFPDSMFTVMDGVNFNFPESTVTGVQWMGDGPYRVWKNRLKGTSFGIWHKAYNNTETGEQWVYPEFKGYYSNMYWCRLLAGDQSFTVFTPDESLYLRLFTPEWKTDQWHNYEPIFPTGNISFMQGIPSIGSKTQGRQTTGPQGMDYIFYDYEKDPRRALVLTLYFDFRAKQTDRF